MSNSLDKNTDTVISIRNVLEITLKLHKSDPVKNYFFWREFNSFLNLTGKSKYEKAARRLAVIHLFRGDNHSEVASKLHISVDDVKNDLRWHYSNKENYVFEISEKV